MMLQASKFLQDGAHITFWRALIISPLLSVPGLFIVKTVVVKEGKKKKKKSLQIISKQNMNFSLFLSY